MLLLLIISMSFSVKASQLLNLITTRSDIGHEPVTDAPRIGAKPLMTKYHVVSRITTRYSRVTITSVVQNAGDLAGEYPLVLRLPKAAFISNFSMEIEGKVYVGEVKEKEDARTSYQQAVSRGQSAGLVATSSRDSQIFDVSISVAPNSSVIFSLNYEELLTRHLGIYTHVLYTEKEQRIHDFEIEVYLSEPSGISLIRTRPADAVIRKSKSQAYIRYPMQRKRDDKTTHFESTSSGNQLPNDTFTVDYDVTREVLGGELMIRNGHFIHFVAPSDLPIIPKNVVFVIDKSGSMRGDKMLQTKQAFKAILNQLQPFDKFNIVTFQSSTKVWKPNKMMIVNRKNIETAKSFIDSLYAYGGTNFYEGAIDGLKLLEVSSSDEANTFNQASMLIILTDGMPTSGLYQATYLIIQHVTRRAEGRYSIFCLGFGRHADHTFLQKLAKANRGVSRRIYEGSDAALQLKNFYNEVASPMLAHVIIKYSGVPVTKLTKHKFDNYFGGSEIVVVGALPHQNTKKMKALVEGTSLKGKVTMEAKGTELNDDFARDDFDLEKVWAYLTIKELLKAKETANLTMIKEINKQALRLSLRYNFVTDLTSLLVVKPKKGNITHGHTDVESERVVLPATKPYSGLSFGAGVTVPYRTPAAAVAAQVYQPMAFQPAAAAAAQHYQIVQAPAPSPIVTISRYQLMTLSQYQIRTAPVYQLVTLPPYQLRTMPHYQLVTLPPYQLRTMPHYQLVTQNYHMNMPYRPRTRTAAAARPSTSVRPPRTKTTTISQTIPQLPTRTTTTPKTTFQTTSPTTTPETITPTAISKSTLPTTTLQIRPISTQPQTATLTTTTAKTHPPTTTPLTTTTSQTTIPTLTTAQSTRSTTTPLTPIPTTPIPLTTLPTTATPQTTPPTITPVAILQTTSTTPQTTPQTIPPTIKPVTILQATPPPTTTIIPQFMPTLSAITETTPKTTTNTRASTDECNAQPDSVNTTDLTCGGNFLINSRLNLVTPNYPGLYPSNAHCSWLLMIPVESRNIKQIQATFTEFDLEEDSPACGGQSCIYDRLQVTNEVPADGYSSNETVGIYCGFKSKPFTVTVKNSMRLEMTTDRRVGGRGFVAVIRLVDK